MGNNVDYVSGLSLFLNGKAIVEFIKELVYATHAAKTKTSVKSVL